jgi:curli biogenesis system outer membrane secretion channel CsgG
MSAFRTAILAAAAAGLAATATAQTPTKKIAVLTFDQRQVQNNLNEVFGSSNVALGRSLANLVAQQLGQAGGWEVVQISSSLPFDLDPTAAANAGRSVGADAVLTGSILGYGSGSSTAGVSGPSVAGVRLGVGRRTTTAAVIIEGRLIDVASSTLLGMVPAQASASRSGTSITVSVPNLISGNGEIDMSRQDFRQTLVGEVTYQAVGTLVRDLGNERARVGAVQAAPPPVAAAPMAAPVVAGPVVAVAPGAPFAWSPYAFRGTEHFKYDVVQTEGRDRATGFYQLDLQPGANPGQVRMRVQGKVGDDEYLNTVTVPVAQQGAQAGTMGMTMGYQQFMALGPIGITLFNPGTWMFLYGHELTVGDEWSQRSGGDSFSVKVETTCSHGGQSGLLVIMRENNVVKQESCVAPGIALPLRVLIVDDDDRMEMTLTEYRP